MARHAEEHHAAAVVPVEVDPLGDLPARHREEHRAAAHVACAPVALQGVPAPASLLLLSKNRAVGSKAVEQRDLENSYHTWSFWRAMRLPRATHALLPSHAPMSSGMQALAGRGFDDVVALHEEKPTPVARLIQSGGNKCLRLCPKLFEAVNV